jgi:hypothetical protein
MQMRKGESMSGPKPTLTIGKVAVRIQVELSWINMSINQANNLREQLAGIEPCVWTQQEDGWWEACNGNAFEITEDSPVANRLNYCPFCGLKIKVKKYGDKN